MSISENLKAARKACGMTQVDAAAHLGVANTTLSNWENDVSRPDIDSLCALCKLYGLTPNDILETGLDQVLHGTRDSSASTVLTEKRMAERLAKCRELLALFDLAEKVSDDEILRLVNKAKKRK
jgi:transcriptional regulator with XRE-family HTH domain